MPWYYRSCADHPTAPCDLAAAYGILPAARRPDHVRGRRPQRFYSLQSDWVATNSYTSAGSVPGLRWQKSAGSSSSPRRPRSRRAYIASLLLHARHRSRPSSAGRPSPGPLPCGYPNWNCNDQRDAPQESRRGRQPRAGRPGSPSVIDRPRTGRRLHRSGWRPLSTCRCRPADGRSRGRAGTCAAGFGSGSGLSRAADPGPGGAAHAARDWLRSSGKTQLAAAFAESLWQSGGLDLLVWIQATSRTAVLSGYAAATATADRPGPGEQ